MVREDNVAARTALAVLDEIATELEDDLKHLTQTAEGQLSADPGADRADY